MEHIGRIKVVIPAKDIMDTVCVCPHCGRHEIYGNMSMVSGIHCCPNCLLKLHNEIDTDKKKNYDTYAKKANSHEYEPYRYKGE